MTQATTPCPCGSDLALEDCCGPLIQGKGRARTAEALMRSRYTAYTLQAIDYLQATLEAGEAQRFDKAATAAWARDSAWKGLEVIEVVAGAPADREGSVEFVARFERHGGVHQHHEISRFRKIDGRWLYCGGKDVGPVQFQRAVPKTGRNDPCPCGSGHKYKKCCGR